MQVSMDAVCLKLLGWNCLLTRDFIPSFSLRKLSFTYICSQSQGSFTTFIKRGSTRGGGLDAFEGNRSPMGSSFRIKSGALVTLNDLQPSSSFFKQGASLRVTGKLQAYSIETAIATVVDGESKLKINTQNLRDVSFRIDSIYQFIGELHIEPDNEAILDARVGRNVDGIDLKLYNQSLSLLHQFQADHLKKSKG